MKYMEFLKVLNFLDSIALMDLPKNPPHPSLYDDLKFLLSGFAENRLISWQSRIEESLTNLDS